MFSTLLRRIGLLPGLVLFLLGLGIAQPALASHLLGGEMTYKYLDATGPASAPLRYEITLKIYNSCTASSGLIRDNYPIAIYNQGSGSPVTLTSTNFPGASGNTFSIQEVTPRPGCNLPPVPPGCTITPGQLSYIKQTFVGVINLPATTAGYYAAWEWSARNYNIVNISGGGLASGNEAMSLYCTMAPPSLNNHSPEFVNEAVANICANDTTYILNNAVDVDGDFLVYSFGTPYNFAPFPGTWTVPPQSVPWTAGYNATYPLGIPTSFPGNYANVNASTGLSKYKTTAAIGTYYVVAVDVSEYRQIGNRRVLIGTTRRDVQLVVTTCSPVATPALPTASSTPRNYTIEAGSSLTIPIAVTQANNHLLKLTATSVLLDSTGGFNASFNNHIGVKPTGSPVGSATASGIAPTSTNFVYNSTCSEVRANPYDIILLVEDKECNGKTIADIFHITVVKPSGPTDITGNFAICGLPSTQQYTAVPGVAPTAPTINWRVVGGTIVGSNTANPVTVNWTTAGTATIVARGVSQYGCFTDSVTKTVVLGAAPSLTVTGNQTICEGASTTLTVSGGTAPYTVTATGLTPVVGAGPFTLTPTATTIYTITATPTGPNCGATTQVTVTVTPKPVANAGTAATICSGGTANLGAAPVAGFTYSWSPTTGLSSATVANPTVTLTNTTSSPIVQTYTLTVTSAGGCVGTGTVAVTVTPPAASAAGSNTTVCSGIPAQLGAAPVAGNTYSWSPTTGLSNPAIANPTATLTNTTTAPITQTYTLTTTTAGGCAATGTVTVTVNPVPVANPGAAVAFCSGGSASLGAAAVTGYTYSWSPATGLSSATVANPTVTLTNTTTAATTQTYTLTVTGPGNCSATGTVVVTVNPLPVANPGAAVAFCSGSSASLGAASVAGYTYSWSPATGLSSATAANPTVTLTNTTGAAITQTYTLTVTGPGNCSSTGTVAVTVNPQPTVTPGAAVAFCSGGSASLGGAPVAGNTYSWSPTTGLSSATVANPTVTLTNTTGSPVTQTYTLTVTNAGGCSGTGTVAVTVNPLPTATPGAAVAFCSGGSASLGSAPVAGNTYSWSPTTGLSSATAANPTVTLTNTTGAPITQTYTLTVTSATNCVSTGTVAVTVNPLPAVTPGAAVAFCSGGSASLGAAPVTGLTYSWSPTTGLSSATVANPTITLTNTTGAPVTQTYTLTVTNTATTCSRTGTVAVTVNPLPTVVPGAAVAFCSGGSASLGAAPVTGLTYSWSPTTGLSSATVANPTVTLTNTTTAATTQTYTLTVTNSATSCVSTGTVAVTVNPIPVAVPGAAVAFCSGGSASLGASPVTGLTYSWSPTTGLSSATVANPTVTLTNTTTTATTQTYTLTVTGPGNCSSTGTVAVTVNPLPTVVPGAAVAFCTGGSASLGAAPVAGLTYSWSPTTGLSSATVANPTVTLTNTTGSPITQTYTLTVTNAGGCVNTGTVAVTVNPLPTAVPGTAVAFCSGGSASLGGAPVAGNTYSWSPTTGLSSATAANPTVTLTNTTGAPITQTYTLTVTSATNCVSTGTVAVTVNPLPTVVPGAAVAFCSGGSASLGAAPVTGLTYSWSPTTGLSSATVANPTVTLTNTTGTAITQTYTLTVTNTATSCTNTGTVAVTVNPLPTVVPGAAAAFCSGGSASLGAAPVTGFTYSWSPTTGLSSATVANPTITLTNTTGAPITQTYTLTVTNSATSCVNTGTVAVTVNPLPVASPGAAVTICSGGSASLGAAPVTGLTYSWSPATGLSSATVANPTVTLTNTTGAPITQTYTLTVTSAANCVTTGTVTVTVVPLPTVVPGSPVTFCSGNTTTLGAAPVAGLTYSWSPATGLSNTAVANPSLTLTNATGVAITPTYTLTVTNAATGCTNTGTVVVTVNSEILPGIVGPGQTVCASSTPQPLTSTPGPSGGYGTYAYQWESSPDNITWTPIANAITATYAPGPLAATTYYRRRVASGSCADAVSNSVMLELVPQLVSSVTLATPPTQCAGLPITFTPTATNVGGSPSYRWFINNVPVASGPTFTSSTLTNGDVVRVEVTPTPGFCATSLAIASVTVNLTLTALPTVVVRTTTALPICAGSPVNFLIDNTTNAGTAPTYQWQVNGVNVAGATSATFTSTTLTDGQVVTLVLSTPSPCGVLTATSNGVTISVNPYVSVNAGPDKTIMEGEVVELEGTASGTFPVTWTPNLGMTFPTNNPLRPYVAPLVTTTYTLAAQVGSCSSESKVTITVTPRVRIPNAFTPNGDGNDDTWQIDRIGDYTSNHVTIFNRWGNKLFETTNYNRGNEWNGNINGQPAPIGTYYYLITLGNGKSYTGPLTIMY